MFLITLYLVGFIVRNAVEVFIIVVYHDQFLKIVYIQLMKYLWRV